MATTPLTVEPSVPVQVQATEPQQPAQNWWDLEPEPVPIPQTTEPQAPALQAPAAADQQWFLRSEDGSIIYRTNQDAVKGLSEKNRTIAVQQEQLARAQKLLEAAGVRVGPQAQPTPDPMVTALESAIQRGDMSFSQALTLMAQQGARQEAQAMLQPLMPLVEHAAITRAVEVAGEQYDPMIPAFVRSKAYQRTLETHGPLKIAIRNAARDPQFQETMLPQLFWQAFLLAKATAPAAAVQRTVPQSTQLPQVVPFGSATPQGTGLTPEGVNVGQFQDPFERAMAQVPDFALTKEVLGR